MNDTAMSKGGQVLAVLSDGPATTGELAAELGWSPRLTCAHLQHLMRRGDITRNDFATGDRRIRFLWMLAEPASA